MSLAAAMAITWWAGTAAADPSSPATGHEPPVVAPPSHDAADERSEQAPANPSPSPATKANPVPSERPTKANGPLQTASPAGRSCAIGGCPKETAAGADPLEPALTVSEVETRWYGYQNMLVDLGGIILAVVAVNESSQEVAGLAVATYVLGSPSVHWGHGHVGKGFGSLGLRVVAPAVGAGLGCAAGGDQGEWGCFGGFFIGGVLGGITAMAVDYAALADEDVPKEAAKRPRLTPSFALVPESGRLMPTACLSGTF